MCVLSSLLWMRAWRIGNQCGECSNFRCEWSVIFQVLVKDDLLNFVSGNSLMDIDAPSVLVVMLPLDALSYDQAIILVFGTDCRP